MNLLVIDESVDYCQTIEALIKQTYPTAYVESAIGLESAIALLNELQFDVVLVSDGTSHLNGFLLISKIKEQLANLQVTLILMSDSSDKEYILKCIHAGAHSVVAKEELDAKIMSHAIVQAQAHCDLDSKLRRSYEKMRHISEHDSLTNVGNRYKFDNALRTAVEQSQGQHFCIGLVMVNIEHFKWVNDAYGHEVGNQVLQHLAQTLRHLAQDNEEVFRLGGDEFAILLTGLLYAHIDDIGQRILEKLKKPLQVGNQKLKINVTMGVAFYPQNARNAAELLRSAGIAEYCSKQTGSNTICFVDDDIKEQFMRRYQIEEDIKLGLERREFVLHYQPMISAKTGHLLSCEALVRWQHPTQGLLFPDQFVHEAEESGLILELGRWIIEEALHQLYQWQSLLDDNLVMSINISPRQLHDPHLVQFLNSKRQQYSLLPSQIEIEITETVLLKNTTDVMRTLNALSSQGYKIALDDFGTGFSSIQHLHSFPISTVKIDKSLMPHKNSSKKSISLLEGLVSMLKSMHLSIVAEGIETQENMVFCQKIGVERLQGYYFSKPVPSDVLASLEFDAETV
ncbi:EAL domain-containing response regulator [Alteromonas sp. a30]|uniref:EAL domain-containing response regulator n=1 Tax=Alteromonas sp. a30 TaxID=2730917 RepID=UPI002280936E|nr:GGDEF domain-containing response regulator [Alteromonas sp. a30]MCY7296673.1 EAL domain-containing protein [Alteromonas sp. a30]